MFSPPTIVLAVRWHKARGQMCSAVLFALLCCSSPADVLTIQDQLHPLPPPVPCSPVRGARSTPHRHRAVQSVCASSTPPIPKPISLPPRTRTKRSLAHQAVGGLRQPRQISDKEKSGFISLVSCYLRAAGWRMQCGKAALAVRHSRPSSEPTEPID